MKVNCDNKFNQFENMQGMNFSVSYRDIFLHKFRHNIIYYIESSILKSITFTVLVEIRFFCEFTAIITPYWFYIKQCYYILCTLSF